VKPAQPRSVLVCEVPPVLVAGPMEPTPRAEGQYVPYAEGRSSGTKVWTEPTSLLGCVKMALASEARTC
jgi:hypothetical protein